MRAWPIVGLGAGLLGIVAFWAFSPSRGESPSPIVAEAPSRATPAEGDPRAAPAKKRPPRPTRPATEPDEANPDLVARYAHGEQYQRQRLDPPPSRPIATTAAPWTEARQASSEEWKERTLAATAEATAHLEPEVQDEVNDVVEEYVDLINLAREDMARGEVSRTDYKQTIGDARTTVQHDLKDILGDDAADVWQHITGASNLIR